MVKVGLGLTKALQGQTFDKVPAAVAISSLDELRSVGDNLLGNNRCVRSTDLLNSRIWTFFLPDRLLPSFALSVTSDCLYSIHALDQPNPHMSRVSGTVYTPDALRKLLSMLLANETGGSNSPV